MRQGSRSGCHRKPERQGTISRDTGKTRNADNAFGSRGHPCSVAFR